MDISSPIKNSKARGSDFGLVAESTNFGGLPTAESLLFVPGMDVLDSLEIFPGDSGRFTKKTFEGDGLADSKGYYSQLGIWSDFGRPFDLNNRITENSEDSDEKIQGLGDAATQVASEASNQFNKSLDADTVKGFIEQVELDHTRQANIFSSHNFDCDRPEWENFNKIVSQSQHIDLKSEPRSNVYNSNQCKKTPKNLGKGITPNSKPLGGQFLTPTTKVFNLGESNRESVSRPQPQTRQIFDTPFVTENLLELSPQRLSSRFQISEQFPRDEKFIAEDQSCTSDKENTASKQNLPSGIIPTPNPPSRQTHPQTTSSPLIHIQNFSTQLPIDTTPAKKKSSINQPTSKTSKKQSTHPQTLPKSNPSLTQSRRTKFSQTQNTNPCLTSLNSSTTKLSTSIMLMKGIDKYCESDTTAEKEFRNRFIINKRTSSKTPPKNSNLRPRLDKGGDYGRVSGCCDSLLGGSSGEGGG
jgi:hypothetical protein